jgi:hypothetical protein
LVGSELPSEETVCKVSVGSSNGGSVYWPARSGDDLDLQPSRTKAPQFWWHVKWQSAKKVDIHKYD